MTNILVPIFGALDPTAPGAWSASSEFDGHIVNFDLMIEGSGITAADVNGLPLSLDELASLDRAARLAILDEAKAGDEDSATVFYLNHYHNVLSAVDFQRLFGTDSADLAGAETMLSRLILVGVAFEPENEDRRVLLDYSIDPDATSRLLCVSFNSNRQPTAVGLES